jgi:hypothetical protein
VSSLDPARGGDALPECRVRRRLVRISAVARPAAVCAGATSPGRMSGAMAAEPTQRAALCWMRADPMQHGDEWPGRPGASLVTDARRGLDTAHHGTLASA